MDKATKVAVEKYPHGTFDGEIGDSLRAACAVGYMQAQKDTIERAVNVLVNLPSLVIPSNYIAYFREKMLEKE